MQNIVNLKCYKKYNKITNIPKKKSQNPALYFRPKSYFAQIIVFTNLLSVLLLTLCVTVMEFVPIRQSHGGEKKWVIYP